MLDYVYLRERSTFSKWAICNQFKTKLTDGDSRIILKNINIQTILYLNGLTKVIIWHLFLENRI